MAGYTHSFPNFMYPTVNVMSENCRQAAHSQDNQMRAYLMAAGMMPNGTNPHPQWNQQNGQMTSDLQRPTSFTNGRKRSRENIECDEMKKAKTEISPHYQQMCMDQMAFNNGHCVQVPPQFQHNCSPLTMGFPSSMVDHQSLMYAERHYDGSLLASLVAEAHGC